MVRNRHHWRRQHDQIVVVGYRPGGTGVVRVKRRATAATSGIAQGDREGLTVLMVDVAVYRDDQVDARLTSLNGYVTFERF